MLNQVAMIGNLTRDPELKYLPSGMAVCKLSIANNRKFKKDGELKDEVCFVEVSVFDKRAEACAEHLAKGSKIGVAGRLKQQRWQSDDGTNHSKHVIVAQEIEFLSMKKTAGNHETQAWGGDTTGDEDIPF